MVEVTGPASKKDKVIRQSPGGGSEGKKGSTVTIYVGKAPASGGNNGQNGGPGGGGPGGGGSSPPGP